MNALTINSFAIRQSENLYSLNDLHKAAGGEDKHRPTFFLRTDQTQALIEELKCADSHTLPVKVETGRKGGTYVAWEIVYSYAMWISAKFSLAVIRAYHALQSSSNPLQLTKPKSKAKALPGGLAIDQQEVIKEMVKARLEAVPQEQRAKAAITCWSALKSKFGDTYKAIPPEKFSDAVSLVARVPLKGEYLPKPEGPTLAGRRFVVSYDMEGKERVQPIEPDAHVMSVPNFLKWLASDQTLAGMDDDLLKDVVNVCSAHLAQVAGGEPADYQPIRFNTGEIGNLKALVKHAQFISQIWRANKMYDHLKGLGSPLPVMLVDHITAAHCIAGTLEKKLYPV